MKINFLPLFAGLGEHLITYSLPNEDAECISTAMDVIEVIGITNFEVNTLSICSVDSCLELSTLFNPNISNLWNTNFFMVRGGYLSR